ncbi:MAG: type II secretion system F family protein [Actinomycetota bacterium]|nr:type II secretion system F family protein [Actinomycetota bacterium]
MLLAGVGLAVGLLLVAHSLMPARPDLSVALARIGRPAANAAVPTRSSLEALARSLGLDRLITHSVAVDLRMIGRPPGVHLARCVTIGLESALVAPAAVGVLALGGITLPVELPIGLVLAFACAGAAMPNLVLGHEARARRRSFNHALSAFLDLVAINLAAGRGIEGALDTAAGAGRGWAFAEIRQALYRAKVMGDSPWSGLDHLGAELGVSDLRELAASVSLAGDNGAKVRNSLAAKAQALRVKGLADVEAAAQSASERMSLPVILLLCGFVLFIGYPAVARVLEGI